MSQPNRLIHSSGLLSFIRCNTDHERPPVSPVMLPLLFLHLSYETCSHSSSKGKPRIFHPIPLSQKKLQAFLFFYFYCCFTITRLFVQLRCKPNLFTVQPQIMKSLVKAAVHGDRRLSKMGESISRIWHTSLSVSLSLSIVYQHCHSLTTLWCRLFLQPAFGLHAIAGKSKSYLKKNLSISHHLTTSLSPFFPLSVSAGDNNTDSI